MTFRKILSILLIAVALIVSSAVPASAQTSSANYYCVTTTLSSGFPTTVCYDISSGTSPGMMMLAYYYLVADFGSLEALAGYLAFLGF